MWRHFSKFVLDKTEVLEKLTSGFGPGGQKVNKSVNCVQLKHLPTGCEVKVHDSRLLHINQKIAWKRLAEKVEHHLNPSESKIGIRIQKQRKQKDRNRRRRMKKLLEKSSSEESLNKS